MTNRRNAYASKTCSPDKHVCLSRGRGPAVATYVAGTTLSSTRARRRCYFYRVLAFAAPSPRVPRSMFIQERHRVRVHRTDNDRVRAVAGIIVPASCERTVHASDQSSVATVVPSSRKHFTVELSPLCASPDAAARSIPQTRAVRVHLYSTVHGVPNVATCYRPESGRVYRSVL